MLSWRAFYYLNPGGRRGPVLSAGPGGRDPLAATARLATGAGPGAGRRRGPAHRPGDGSARAHRGGSRATAMAAVPPGAGEGMAGRGGCGGRRAIRQPQIMAIVQQTKSGGASSPVRPLALSYVQVESGSRTCSPVPLSEPPETAQQGGPGTPRASRSPGRRTAHGGKWWQEYGLVFCREDGTPLDRWHVREGVPEDNQGRPAWRGMDASRAAALIRRVPAVRQLR